MNVVWATMPNGKISEVIWIRIISGVATFLLVLISVMIYWTYHQNQIQEHTLGAQEQLLSAQVNALAESQTLISSLQSTVIEQKERLDEVVKVHQKELAELQHIIVRLTAIEKTRFTNSMGDVLRAEVMTETAKILVDLTQLQSDLATLMQVGPEGIQAQLERIEAMLLDLIPQDE